ncbi:HTH-type transcriptional repressor CarH [Tepidimonas thermarum]|uniref:HTH-type transcriptional repressor CarH n=1 Tax=Tepidimonas thermarum TaxID=335431 RepID=A0A554X293_9BURK|nr:cobalamin B12-binding domain-containing protein [Tepidimonas thermarum]TSE29960.1 HTH-type transcriptional repressor CarH [Tepidimonas thermarum]
MSSASADHPRPAPVARWAIADVERETGIGKDTLRVWERRYGFPVPRRDERGDRLYDAEQMARLRLIRRLLDAGHRPGRVVGLGAQALEDLVAALEPATGAPDGCRGAATDWATWMAWLRTDQTLRLRDALREAVRTQGLAQAVEGVIAPLCVEVGQAWLRGDIGVYQEHLFTEAVQMVLREAIVRLDEAQPTRAPRVLLTTTPGEQHQLGLLMAECFLALQGCERLSLGVSTPLQDILEAMRRTDADVLALSYSERASRRDVLDTVAPLRAQLPARVALWLGGAAAWRYRRGLPAGVLVLRRAADLSAQVEDWRRQHDPVAARGT